MIRNLGDADGPCTPQPTPVCILGAGTGGLFLAELLRRRGLSSTILEAGTTAASQPGDIGEQVIQRGLTYRGADLGRSFGLGGTSVLWGGQLIPVTRHDVGARPAVKIERWPVDYDELARYFPTVEEALGLPLGEEADEEALVKDRFPSLLQLPSTFDLRLSKWLPFRRRNFSKAFDASLESSPRVDVWLDARATHLGAGLGPSGRIMSIVARSRSGHRLVVHPQIVVVAAGALESTRLLLELDDETDGLLTKHGSSVGRYFSDHLSASCGYFRPLSATRYNLATAPVFHRGVMRTPRLELSAAAQDTLGVASGFAHFTFTTSGASGLDVVRNFLRNRQGEQRSLGVRPGTLGRATSDILSMGLWRFGRRRLWVPREAQLILQIDIEQLPNPRSRLSLSDERDGEGRKRLVVDWQITPEDTRALETVAIHFSDAWNGSDLRASAELEMSLPGHLSSFESLYDVYHPTGSLRMGKSPENSVVDANLRLWELENLYVSSTAVFPSCGSANPGMTHLALTARLAEHLKRTLD